MKQLMIIGNGPAAISAALTAKARDLDFFWLGPGGLSPKIEKAERIFNYPGLPHVTGEEMSAAFRRQLEEAGIGQVKARIHTMMSMGGSFIAGSSDQIFEAKAVILCTGAASAGEVPGESRLLGRGVSYCATCDGALYRGREMAVVCTDPEQEDEIDFLAKLASKVTVISPYEVENDPRENVIRRRGYPTEVLGGSRVEGLALGEETVPADVVFFLRAAVRPSTLLPGLEMDGPHIRVDRQMRTNIPGCFAAGDCTGRPYQYAKAVGEGNVALHSALEYLKAESR